MRIKMLKTTKPDFPFLSEPGTILFAGTEYEATANQHGAICGICENGVKMGVRSGEFIFIDAPSWVVDIWSKAYPAACAGVVINDEEERV